MSRSSACIADRPLRKQNLVKHRLRSAAQISGNAQAEIGMERSPGSLQWALEQWERECKTPADTQQQALCLR